MASGPTGVARSYSEPVITPRNTPISGVFRAQDFHLHLIPFSHMCSVWSRGSGTETIREVGPSMGADVMTAGWSTKR